MILLVPNRHIRNDTSDTKRDSQLGPQASQIWAFYSNSWASGESEISSKGAFKWGLMIKQGFKKQICQVRQERLDEGEWTEGILTKLCLEFVCLFVFRIFQIGRIFSFCFNTILFFFYFTVLYWFCHTSIWPLWVSVAACGLSLFAAAGGCSLVAVWERLTAVVSPVAEHGLSGMWASTAAGCRLQSLWHVGLVPVACDIFPDQGSNLCLQHWQGHPPPPDPPGKSCRIIFKKVSFRITRSFV